VALSDRAVRELAQIRRARGEHEHANTAEPTTEELSRATGLTRTQVESLQATERAPRRMEAELSADDESAATVADALVDPAAEKAYQQASLDP
jgi:DNA-directed RNA polymerase sigma subunit (sigma70/sigma32)